MIWAAQNGEIEVVETLMGNGANIYSKNKNGLTATMKALQHGHLQIVKILTENGANQHILRTFSKSVLTLSPNVSLRIVNHKQQKGEI